MSDEVHWLLAKFPYRFPVEARESSVVDVDHVELVQAQPLGDELTSELAAVLEALL